MAYFKRDRFSGIVPALSPRLINDQFAQIAENVDFESGSLSPITNDVLELTLQSGDRRSVYFYDNAYWLQWAQDGVSAVAGPIPDDTNRRLYWTGQDYPRMGTLTTIVSGSSGYPANSYRLGVPAPQGAPTLSKNGTPDDTQTPDDVAYVYTYVTAFGEEGPPSLASEVLERTDTETIEVSIPTDVSGNYNFGTGALKRIYRSNTGSTNATYQFVGEVAFTASTFTDTVPSAGLGEVLPSTTWIGPPDDNTTLYPDGPMKSLIPVANGTFAGFSGKRFCLSEPYLPHAWPVDYRITIERDIVAIAAVSNGVVVLTDGTPYFVTGTEPSSMTAIRVDLAQACINEHSVVDMGEYVLYAGPDGLCSVASAQGQVTSEGVISAKQWNADFNPTGYRAFRHEGTYVAFWTDNGEHKGFVYDPRGNANALSLLTTDAEVRGGYMNPQNGQLYLIVNDQLVAYRGGSTTRELKWKSKQFIADKPISMGWVAVEAQDYPVNLKVWADGVLIADYDINFDGTNFTQGITVPNIGQVTPAVISEPMARLPAKVAKIWEFQVTGSTQVDAVWLAQGMDEIALS